MFVEFGPASRRMWFYVAQNKIRPYTESTRNDRKSGYLRKFEKNDKIDAVLADEENLNKYS